MRFDLESLQVLVSVIEEGSLAAASERQHIVPSAISRRIAELEERVAELEATIQKLQQVQDK